MRETTRLLCAHVHIRPVAELIESYIMPTRRFDPTLVDHWELVSHLRDLSDLRCALTYAAMDNNISMIEMLVKNGADSKLSVISGACQGGHVELATLAYDSPGDMGDVLMGTLHAGSIRALKWILCRTDPRFHGHVYMNAFALALERKKPDIVTYCINHGEFDASDGLYYACLGGDRGLILLMRTCGLDTGDVCEGLRGACNASDVRIAKWMIFFGANNWDECLAECIYNVYDRKFALAALMIASGARDICALSWINAHMSPNPEVVEWIRLHMTRPCSECSRLADEHEYLRATT